MPEEIEFEPPAPHEVAHHSSSAHGHDSLEPFQHGWSRLIPLSTAMLAVVAAIAALTRRRWVWYASMGVGLIGVAFFAQGLLRS